jgi:hypothetical protein
MIQLIYARPLLEPGRVVVMHDGVVMAMGTIQNFGLHWRGVEHAERRPLSEPGRRGRFQGVADRDRAMRRLN